MGKDVRGVSIGDRVAALTKFDSHTQFIYWPVQELVHVPETPDPAEAVTLIQSSGLLTSGGEQG